MIRACALVALAGCLGKPSFECELAPVATTDTTAHIGANGGVPQDPVTCNGFVVGVTAALTAERDGGHGNAFIVVKLAVLCAPISQRDDAFVTGPAAVELIAQGAAPIQGDQTASCNPGEALVGIDAHMVTTDGLFNSMSIECAALTPTGARADAHAVVVPSTGVDIPDAHAMCGDGEVVTGMRGWTGNELDQLQISCSAPGCS